MGVTPSLQEFLLARYDERVQAARAASQGTWVVGRTASAEGDVYGSHISVLGDRPGQVADMEWSRDDEQVANAEHIALNDPVYVLSDIAAKRFVVDTLRSYEPSDEWDTEPDIGKRKNNAAGALRRMALPFAGHPDYDPSWRPA